MKNKILLQVRIMTYWGLIGLFSQTLFLNIVLASAGTAQKNMSIENIFVKLPAKGMELKQVFRAIEKQTEFEFSYDAAYINDTERINIDHKKSSLDKVLKEIAYQKVIDFRRVDGLIYVKKSKNDGSVKQVYSEVDVSINGKVTDESGQGLPGVSIVIKGTTTGTTTDLDGNYKFTAPEEAILVFSYVGYRTAEVTIGGRTTIDLKMDVDAEQLDEVVVTALGIERDKDALGYSVAELDGKQFTEARETNISNALAGKVAGVSVSNVASGPGGTSRVVIRGSTSLTGNNQPLYVIDGIPIDNSIQGSAGMWGGRDQGDGIGNINPDDIEEMSVLKGNTAAALYGSRASNGVILITTKSGKTDQGLKVEFNSNYTFDKAVSRLDPQKEYGSGLKGVKPGTQDEALAAGESSWGAKLDGSQVIQFDGVSRPYSYAGDNFAKFYETGHTFTNTLSLSGGNQNMGYRFSASKLDNKGVMPNSGLNRSNFSFNVNGKAINDKLTFQASGQYINQDVKNPPQLADSPGNANYSVWQLPPSVDVRNLIGSTDRPGAREDNGYELLPGSSIWFQNPYWAAYQYENNNSRNRVLGSMKLAYDITDWLFVSGRVGIDQWDRLNNGITPTGTSYAPDGGISQSQVRQKETNSDIMLGSKKEFDNGIGYNVLIGGNRMRREYNSTSASGSNYALPFFNSINNGINKSGGSDFTAEGINSIYGLAEFSYNSWLYLTGSGRTDWFSTLNGRSIFYPSVSASTVLSELIEMPVFMDYSKVRIAWAQVGGATSPYQLNQTYGLNNAHLGVPQGGISGSVVKNADLVPLTVSEFEIGFDVQFLERRLGLDITYYNRNTKDDILDATISQTSGYTGAKVNVGESSNKGVEVLLTGTPVRSGDFQWNISLNMAYNKSKVISLLDPEIDDEVLNVERSRALNTWVQQIEGMPYGQISGFKYLRDANGDIALDDSGLPIQDTELGIVPFGTGVHPFTAGLQNNFSYKNFNFGFLIDMKDGALIHSGTNAQLYRRGIHKNTLVGRESGLGDIPASEIDTYYNYIFNNISEEFIYDASFIKFRELTVGYRIPPSILQKLGVSGANLSFVGRNLFLLKSSVDNIDPESTYNAGNGQGLDFLSMPQTRSYGFNLNIKF